MTRRTAPGPVDVKGKAIDLQRLAGALDAGFNGPTLERRDIGFALLVFPLDGEPGDWVHYTSNAARDDMLKAMKLFIAGQEKMDSAGGQA